MERRQILRELRRFTSLRGIAILGMLTLWAGFVFVSVSAARKLIALDLSSLTRDQATLAPEMRLYVAEASLVLRALQAASTEVVVGVTAAAAMALALVVVVTNRLFFADKVSVLGFSFEISETLRKAEERAFIAERTLAGLGENIHELQEIGHHLNVLVREPSGPRFFDFLDAVAQTAAFTIKPASRAVRVSIWLYQGAADRLRIIASYRVAASTRETFEMARNDPGFAAAVLRDAQLIVKNENFTHLSRDWKEDPRETHGTVSILGVPVVVDDGGWGAVLCFSTDRPEDAFSREEDRAEAEYFATLTSTLLSLAWSSDSDGRTSMVEQLWTRYRRS